MARRLFTGALGIALMTVGLAAVYGEPLLGWLEASLGILVILSIAGSTDPRRYGSAIGGAALAGATLSLALLALALRANRTMVGSTLAIAAALLATDLPLRKSRL